MKRYKQEDVIIDMEQGSDGSFHATGKAKRAEKIKRDHKKEVHKKNKQYKMKKPEPKQPTVFQEIKDGIFEGFDFAEEVGNKIMRLLGS